MTLESNQLKDGYRPTFEDLRRRAEEGGYGGGRGKMDSREWYELCYFEPLEDLMLESLTARYYPKEMDLDDVAICMATWIYANSVNDMPRYKDIIDRNFWLTKEGAEDPDIAMMQSYECGLISYDDPPTLGSLVDDGVVVTLRPDIDKFLSELVDKICAENDANIVAKHGKQAVRELQKLHKEKLLEFWREPSIPVTDQERVGWMDSLLERQQHQQQEEDSNNGRGSG